MAALCMLVSCGRIGYDPNATRDAMGGEDATADDDANSMPSLGVELPLDTGTGAQNNPMALWANGRMVVTWKSVDIGLPSVKVATYDALGALLSGPSQISGALAADDSWLASSGSFLGAVWTEDTNLGIRIFFRLLSLEGVPVAPAVPLSTVGAPVIEPRIGWTGQNFVAIWEDSSGSRRLHAAIIDSDGIVTAPDHLFQDSGSFQRDSKLNVVAGTLVVTWTESSGDDQILVASVNVDGTPMPAIAIGASPPTPRSPDIDGASDSYAVAYHNNPAGTFGVFANFDGTEELAVRPNPPLDTDEVTIARSQDSDVYALVWDGADLSGIEANVDYALISQSRGVIVTGSLSELKQVSSAHPSVIWADGVFLAVWEGDSPMNTGGDAIVFRSIIP